MAVCTGTRFFLENRFNKENLNNTYKKGPKTANNPKYLLSINNKKTWRLWRTKNTNIMLVCLKNYVANLGEGKHTHIKGTQKEEGGLQAHREDEAEDGDDD